MNETTKQFIEKTLKKLPFVQWDRYIDIFGEGDIVPSGVSVYGWIDREQDQYKDFVLIEFNIVDNAIVIWNTSSASRSEEIAKLLGQSLHHSECKRVEQFFAIDNVIRLD